MLQYMIFKENKKINILEYGLYLLVFFLPLQTRWMFKLGTLQGEYWEYSTMSLYAVDILVIGLLLYYFINKKIIHLYNEGITLPKLNVWLLVGSLELFVFLSIFFASHIWLAVYGYARFLLAIGLFFLVTQINYHKIKLYWAIIAAGFLQSILAIEQFINQSVFGSKWLGMAAQNAGKAGVSVVEVGIERWLRAYGSLSHPNILGGFLTIALLINILLYFALFSTWQKLGSSARGKKYKIGLLISLAFFIINLVGLLLTFSRSAWLALAVGLALLVPLFWKQHGRIGLINISKFVFIAISISGLFAYLFWGPVSTRLNVSDRLENISINERINYAGDARQVIMNHWLVGAGIKNYGLTLHSEVDSKRSVYAYEPVHNAFLLIWAEAGIFGLFVFIGLIIFIFFDKIKKHSYGKSAVIAALTILLFFDHWLWSLSFGLYFFWLVIGLGFISGQQKEHI